MLGNQEGNGMNDVRGKWGGGDPEEGMCGLEGLPRGSERTSCVLIGQSPLEGVKVPVLASVIQCA